MSTVATRSREVRSSSLFRLPVSITSTVRGGSLLISSDCGRMKLSWTLTCAVTGWFCPVTKSQRDDRDREREELQTPVFEKIRRSNFSARFGAGRGSEVVTSSMS